MEKINTFEAYLINAEKEETINQAGKTIYIIPLWKWLLD